MPKRLNDVLNVDPPPREKADLLDDSINLCHQICYRGVKRQQIHKVVGCGIYLLRVVLRYSHLNELGQIKQKSLAIFDDIEASIKYEFGCAAKWIQFQKEVALALDQDELPDLSGGLFNKLGI